jgi:hypothetical protein
MRETAPARGKTIAVAAGGYEEWGGVLSCGIKVAPNAGDQKVLAENVPVVEQQQCKPFPKRLPTSAC